MTNRLRPRPANGDAGRFHEVHRASLGSSILTIGVDQNDVLRVMNASLIDSTRWCRPVIFCTGDSLYFERSPGIFSSITVSEEELPLIKRMTRVLFNEPDSIRKGKLMWIPLYHTFRFPCLLQSLIEDPEKNEFLAVEEEDEYENDEDECEDENDYENDDENNDENIENEEEKRRNAVKLLLTRFSTEIPADRETLRFLRDDFHIFPVDPMDIIFPGMKVRNLKFLRKCSDGEILNHHLMFTFRAARLWDELRSDKELFLQEGFSNNERSMIEKGIVPPNFTFHLMYPKECGGRLCLSHICLMPRYYHEKLCRLEETQLSCRDDSGDLEFLLPQTSCYSDMHRWDYHPSCRRYATEEVVRPSRKEKPKPMPNPKEIEKFREYWTSRRAFLQPGASEKGISEVSLRLRKSGFPPIPEDYQAFLRATDGLEWMGIAFYPLFDSRRKRRASISFSIWHACLKSQDIAR